MSDASEVLSAIYESLSLVDEGQKLVRDIFEWQVNSPITMFCKYSSFACQATRAGNEL
jgi:hypothetical protein